MSSVTPLVIIFGLSAALSWGLSDFFAARASKRANPLLIALWVLVTGAIAYTVLYAVGLGHHAAWNQKGIELAAIAGLVLTMALAAFYRGLSIGPVSIVSPIGAAYPLITTLIVIIVFHGHLTAWQVGAVVITVLGIMLTSGLLGTHKTERRLGGGTMYALAACLLWGIMYVLLGKAVTLIGWQKTTLIYVWFTVVGCVALLPSITLQALTDPANLRIALNKYVLGASLMQLTGEASINLGLTHSSSPAIVAALSACYPALTVILALIVFKEKISAAAKAGIVTTIIGVAIISHY